MGSRSWRVGTNSAAPHHTHNRPIGAQPADWRAPRRAARATQLAGRKACSLPAVPTKRQDPSSSVPKTLDTLDAYDGDALMVVIETPKGSQNKFVFEPRFGAFVLKGMLPVGAVFPFDFGMIPSTEGGDGDPLDILILMDAPAYPGCIVPARLIGVIEAQQTEDGRTEQNDRLLAVASNSARHQSIRELADLSPDLIGQIEHFFISYNSAKGKEFKPTGRFGPDRAAAVVDAGIALARKTRT
jgi:inorganic pyrophosphatase